MTVQCPRCRTQYKVPSTRISDPRPVFKCTRCSLVFSGEGERGQRGTSRAKEDKNLQLPFTSRERAAAPSEEDVTEPGDDALAEEEDEEEAQEQDEEETADEAEAAEEEEDEPPAKAPRRTARTREKAPPAREPLPEPAFVARVSRERDDERERSRERGPSRRGNGGRRDELRFRRDDDLDEDLADDDDEQSGPVLSASEGKQRRPPINPRRGIRSATAAVPRRSPLRAVTMGVALVTVVYLGLAVALEQRPEAAIETLGRVPVLGRLLGGDHLLVWRLQLTDVDGGFDQIKGGRPAYVVTGRALNTTNEDLRVIEVEGRLLVNGVEQRRQTTYAANQQRKTIQDLSPSEVEMLLRLEPNRRFVIHPGESASFLLVFPNPPPGATEVTCRVLDARAT